MVILFLGIVYIMSQRSGTGFVSFILVGAAAVTMFYWVRVLKKMAVEKKPEYPQREQETKNWVYDLIKGEGEFVFVAEVPGPEDRIMVRLGQWRIIHTGREQLFKRSADRGLGRDADRRVQVQKRRAYPPDKGIIGSLRARAFAEDTCP
ncbi:hypothetical protein CENSYa_0785 [Cenarchaeum symbiosum A]|uniref:Hsp20/alpha crystallin family protein n=1 Tax=Cenarchaeum symbiosum (strain A) TaxID=414004 RepID=A0RVQ1_CENSY|nr:hypothetical protein CENSYa_0785 [Cenarchaeum symbiosum A]